MKYSEKDFSQEEIDSLTNNPEADRPSYPALRTLATLFSFLGYIIIIVGAGAFFVFYKQDELFYGIISVLAGGVISLPLFAFSNLIYLFIDIERNTRHASNNP